MATTTKYQPGVCNIGNAEAAQRRRTGLIGWTVTVVLAALLWVSGLPAAVLLATALPAFVGATGLIQAQRNFCAGYGQHGMYNFTDQLGKYTESTDADAAAADKKTAIRITVQAAIIGLVAGVGLTVLRASVG